MIQEGRVRLAVCLGAGGLREVQMQGGHSRSKIGASWLNHRQVCVWFPGAGRKATALEGPVCEASGQQGTGIRGKQGRKQGAKSRPWESQKPATTAGGPLPSIRLLLFPST